MMPVRPYRTCVLAVLAAVGCVDFIQPELPELGAAAIIEATIRLTDRGTVEIDARLVPGLDEAGFRRGVRLDTIEVLGRRIGADSIARNGTRRYVEQWEAGREIVGEPITFHAPELSGVSATPPAVRWAGVRRADSDTVVLDRGSELRLLVAPGDGSLDPPPDIRQWFLRLDGDDGGFNIGADGPPPDTIFVPSRWIPAGDTVHVRLIFSQSVLLQQPPGDYVGLVTLDTRLFWTLLLRDAGAPR
jgi:hypothetical protein